MPVLPGAGLEGDELMAPIIEIWADFNARLEDNRVSLMTRGSQAALKDYWPSGNYDGNKIFICDGEIGAVAIIEEGVDGYPLAARMISPVMEIEN